MAKVALGTLAFLAVFAALVLVGGSIEPQPVPAGPAALGAREAHQAAERRAVSVRTDRRDLGAEPLDRAQHVAVIDGAEAHVREVALVAEQLVLEQDLLGDLLRARRPPARRAVSAARGTASRPIGGQPRSRPIRLIIAM